MVHVDANNDCKVGQHDALQKSNVRLGNLWVDQIVVHMEVSLTSVGLTVSIVLVFFIGVAVSRNETRELQYLLVRVKVEADLLKGPEEGVARRLRELLALDVPWVALAREELQADVFASFQLLVYFVKLPIFPEA